MLDMSLEGTNAKGIWDNSSRQRVPKPNVIRKNQLDRFIDI